MYLSATSEVKKQHLFDAVPYKSNLNAIYFLIVATLVFRLLTGAVKPFGIAAPNNVFTALYLILIASTFIVVNAKWSQFGLALFFVIYNFISLFHTNFDLAWMIAQINSGLRYIIVPLTIYLAGIKPSRKKLKNTFYSISFALLLFSFLGVILGLSREIQGVNRQEFPFENPNSLGISLSLIVWSFVLIKLNLKKSTNIVDLLFDSIVLVGCLFFVYKSGSFNAIITSFLALSYLFYRSSVKVVYKLILLIFGLLPGLFFVDLNFAFDRFQQVFLTVDISDVTGGGSSLAWRLNTWASYLNFMDSSAILFGHGLGSSRIWFEPWAPGFLINSNGDIPGTHNDYIMVYFDMGFLGVAILFYCFFAIYKKAMSFGVKGLRAAFVSVALSMFFDNLIDAFIFVPFVLIVAILINIRIIERHRNNICEDGS